MYLNKQPIKLIILWITFSPLQTIMPPWGLCMAVIVPTAAYNIETKSTKFKTRTIDLQQNGINVETYQIIQWSEFGHMIISVCCREVPVWLRRKLRRENVEMQKYRKSIIMAVNYSNTDLKCCFYSNIDLKCSYYSNIDLKCCYYSNTDLKCCWVGVRDCHAGFRHQYRTHKPFLVHNLRSILINIFINTKVKAFLKQ